VRRRDRRSTLIFAAKVAGAVALVLFIVIERPFLPSHTRLVDANVETYVSGFDKPTFVAAAPGQPNRLYVVEQLGRIRYVDGRRIAGTLLDIRTRVRLGGERGLFSVAFSPSYATNRLFYVDYTDLNGDTRVVEFRSRKDRAILASARQILFVDQPYPNHNGGQLQFGPDGLLYVGMGDAVRAATRCAPEDVGRYFFGDWCTGTIWSLRIKDGRALDLRKEHDRIGQLSSFGEGSDGTLYAVSVGSGRLYRLVD
jgi:glucose/arabinose dehydrogenase